MAFTHANVLNKFGEARLIVATSAANGTHTTLASAMADASVGDTIFLRDSVTENVTITPGVNIAGWSAGTLNTPTASGTITMTGAGTSTISGLRLATNGAELIALTGSAASILNVNDCYLNMSSDGITYSSSSSSSKLNLLNCRGDLTTTGIKIFAHSSAGSLIFDKTLINNTGGSTTANTQSAGTLNLYLSQLSNPLTTSGTTASYSASRSGINCNTLNVTALTHGSTLATPSASGSSTYSSGNAAAVTISAGASLNMISDLIGSNVDDAITGAGTISYGNMTFFGTTMGNITTTNKSDSSRCDLGFYRATQQPSFLATASNQTNVTGDGTIYTVLFATEVYDINGDYSSPTFTAPVTGRYNLGALVEYNGLAAANTNGSLGIVTSNRSYGPFNGNIGAIRNTGAALNLNGNVITDMDAADTATITATVSGATKIIGVSANGASRFWGNLLN